MRTLAILLTTALGVAILAPDSTAQTISLDGCTDIDAPGMYQVARNIEAPFNDDPQGSACIRLNASLVTIDLGGFSIIPSGGGGLPGFRQGEGIGTATFGPVAPRQGIVVRNGSIFGFGTGINLSNVEGVIVENIRALNNDEAIVVGPLSIVKDNVVIDNGTGIIASGESIITGNVSTNNQTGPAIDGGANSIITNNNVSSNMDNGIVTLGGSTVTGNTVSRNFDGIVAGEGSTVMGNTSGNNSHDGIRVNCRSNVIGNTTWDGNVTVLVGSGCNNINNVPTGTIRPQ